VKRRQEWIEVPFVRRSSQVLLPHWAVEISEEEGRKPVRKREAIYRRVRIARSSWLLFI
jgi:hypothetical protein